VPGLRVSSQFLPVPTSELRQGDVCYQWQFPKWQLNSYQVAFQPSAARPNSAIVSLHSKGEILPLIICSHDCDLENPRSRMGIIVAPVLSWPDSDQGSELSAKIQRSDVPGNDGAYAHINLFPIKIPRRDWRVVDFSALTSVSTPDKVVPALRLAKKYEMTDEAREKFSNKLAAFFIRQN
jgi:hypothetical protein